MFVLVVIINQGSGIWSTLQDVITHGAGNVGYSAYLTLPLYLTTSARDRAIQDNSDEKYKVYGGMIRYGIIDDVDLGISGNYSINSSIGIFLKYRPEKFLASTVGIDYILDEMLLAPYLIIGGGKDITRNFSFYCGLKGFYWQNFYINQAKRDNLLGTVLFGGLHLYRKEGFRDVRLSSFVPMGVYLEIGYPLNPQEHTLTITLGLDGFLGFSLPRP